MQEIRDEEVKIYYTVNSYLHPTQGNGKRNRGEFVSCTLPSNLCILKKEGHCRSS